MPQVPGAHLVTLHHPCSYLPSQIDRAAAIAHALYRGQFILVERPAR